MPRTLKKIAPPPKNLGGRPKKDDSERADYRLTVRLKNEVGAQLEAEAKRRDVTIATVVKEALVKAKVVKAA